MYFRFLSICVNPIPHVPVSILQDQYGNYVMQHILEHGDVADRSGIIHKLCGQLTTLSQHKYARWGILKLKAMDSCWWSKYVVLNNMLMHVLYM